MNILLISKQPVDSLFGKQIPFENTSCVAQQELPHNAELLYDLIIDLDFEEHTERKEMYAAFTKPVFIGSVLYTLHDLQLQNSKVTRFNHWPFFKDRSCIEFFCSTNHEELFTGIFTQLSLTAYKTADVHGFVSTRVIANIINEAFFAEGEQVSTKEEIDIAMKLGTNYPYGPFEWSRKIGIEKTILLLQKMATADYRYEPSANLLKEVNAL